MTQINSAGTAIGSAWTALGGDPALLPRVAVVEREGALRARLPAYFWESNCLVGTFSKAGSPTQ
ncbi:hypothetical protein ABZ651_20805, partial [Streptomyces sp. NPDC007070]